MQNWLSIWVEVGVPVSEGVALAVSLGLGVDVADDGALNVGVKSLTIKSPLEVGLGVVATKGGVDEVASMRKFNKPEENRYMLAAPNAMIAANNGNNFALLAAGIDMRMDLGSLLRCISLSILHSL